MVLESSWKSGKLKGALPVTKLNKSFKIVFQLSFSNNILKTSCIAKIAFFLAPKQIPFIFNFVKPSEVLSYFMETIVTEKWNGNSVLVARKEE